MSELQMTVPADELHYLMGSLEQKLKETEVEEHRTRTPIYREHLIHEEDLIRSLLAKLRHSAE